jgi:SAM-dependent methyltransferase
VSSFALAKKFDGGVLDTMDVEPSGEILLCGWSRSTSDTPPFVLVIDGMRLERREEFWLRRPDLTSVLRSGSSHHGFGIVFHAPQAWARNVIEVRLGARAVVSVRARVARIEPHYSALFEEPRVLHRQDVYGYGPPTSEVDVQVLELARTLPEPVLDFGCGSGALVRALLSEGRTAEGIELRRPEIIASLKDDVRPFVKLHEGEFPLPYRDDQFAAVICSEVLEHVPDWEKAVQEFGRIARHAIITVPDMSAIPSLYPHRVVPWHLLESTHVNFFTQRSLHDAVRGVFPRIRFLRFGQFLVNGTRVFTSLVADCRR